MTIWQFWEGPRPAFIGLCLDTVRRHHPDVRLLDRKMFDALWTRDRDIVIDHLGLNHQSDFIRAYLLMHHGGLYLDADAIVMRPLSVYAEMAQAVGFVGYREPQGYMSCNFMAARAGHWIIADHYRRVTARLRDPRPLEWLDLASTPMDIAVRDYGCHGVILPTQHIMPIGWHESEKLAIPRDDCDHAAHFDSDAGVWMLSNNTIKSDARTRHLALLPREHLLAGRSFLSFLFRVGLELPPRDLGLDTAQPEAHLGGHEDLTQYDEGAFDYLARRFAVRSFLDVGCGPGGMAAYALSRGIAARGVDGDPRHARGSLLITEHDYAEGPLDAGSHDLGWAVEFVEHVEERYVPHFMATFAGCRHVFITAAVPGQPGHHHVNCQWGDYWIARFAEAGFVHDAEATAGVRAASTMKSGFTAQTGLVFRRQDDAAVGEIRP